jgi:hypothetical protein
MAKRARTPAPTGAERRTATLPCMPPAPAPKPRARQLSFPVALGLPEDQFVMPGCEDAEPRRGCTPKGSP